MDVSKARKEIEDAFAEDASAAAFHSSKGLQKVVIIDVESLRDGLMKLLDDLEEFVG